MQDMNSKLSDTEIIKILIYLVVFIIIVMLFVFVIIIPNVKDYRVEKKLERRAYKAYSKVQNNLDERQDLLKNLKSDNLKIIKSFDNLFDEQKFAKLLEEYFEATTFSKVDSKGYRENFIVYELNVSTSIETPLRFYEFLDHLNRFDNIIKANFPIEFASNDGFINSSFTIEVYEVNASSR
jgi:competence protein ComGC